MAKLVVAVATTAVCDSTAAVAVARVAVELSKFVVAVATTAV